MRNIYFFIFLITLVVHPVITSSLEELKQNIPDIRQSRGPQTLYMPPAAPFPLCRYTRRQFSADIQRFIEKIICGDNLFTLAFYLVSEITLSITAAELVLQSILIEKTPPILEKVLNDRKISLQIIGKPTFSQCMITGLKYSAYVNEQTSPTSTGETPILGKGERIQQQVNSFKIRVEKMSFKDFNEKMKKKIPEKNHTESEIRNHATDITRQLQELFKDSKFKTIMGEEAHVMLKQALQSINGYKGLNIPSDTIDKTVQRYIDVGLSETMQLHIFQEDILLTILEDRLDRLYRTTEYLEESPIRTLDRFLENREKQRSQPEGIPPIDMEDTPRAGSYHMNQRNGRVDTEYSNGTHNLEHSLYGTENNRTDDGINKLDINHTAPFPLYTTRNQHSTTRSFIEEIERADIAFTLSNYLSYEVIGVITAAELELQNILTDAMEPILQEAFNDTKISFRVVEKPAFAKCMIIGLKYSAYFAASSANIQPTPVLGQGEHVQQEVNSFEVTVQKMSFKDLCEKLKQHKLDKTEYEIESEIRVHAIDTMRQLKELFSDNQFKKTIGKQADDALKRMFQHINSYSNVSSEIINKTVQRHINIGLSETIQLHIFQEDILKIILED